MNITEMYEEMVDQEVVDIFLDGESIIVDDYDIEDVMEEFYDI